MMPTPATDCPVKGISKFGYKVSYMPDPGKDHILLAVRPPQVGDIGWNYAGYIMTWTSLKYIEGHRVIFRKIS